MSLKLYRKNGSPNWYIRGTVRGITVDESSKVSDKSAAETIRAKREWECIEQSVVGKKASATFLEAAVSYMESGGEARFVHPVLEYFRTTPLAKIDQQAIDKCAKDLYPDAKPSTINRQVHTVISAVLRHAHRRGLCELRLIERPRQPKGRVRWITPEEAERLIAACAPHLRPLVVFLLYTGCRLSEALYIDWRQVSLERRQAQFLKTKNEHARGVPLHERVVEELTALPHRDGAVFRRPRDKEPYSEKSDGGGQIKTAFSGACRRSGITGFSPHDCRHTWATWHYAANRDLTALMELGGWQSEKMVLRYAHVNVEHLADSIASLPWEKSGNTPATAMKKSPASRA